MSENLPEDPEAFRKENKAMRKDPRFRLAAKILPHLISTHGRSVGTSKLEHRRNLCREALGWAYALELAYAERQS